MWTTIVCLVLSVTAEGGEQPQGNNMYRPEAHVLVDFTEAPLPSFVHFNNTAPGVRRVLDGVSGLHVDFDQVDWPNVFFSAPDGVWDWRDYAGVGVSLYNPSDVPITVAMRVDNAGADGVNFCNNLRTTILPHARLAFDMLFARDGAQTLWGMRGIPGEIQYGEGKPLDLSRITAFQIFLPQPRQPHVLVIERAHILPKDAARTSGVSMPFVDPFGQYIHDEWPGKLKDPGEFVERKEAEQAAWLKQPELPERDRFGGWAAGPVREATGWFRTEKIGDAWWLVTPEGTLFLSFGINCVGTWERTFVEQREDWFAWLPDADDARFGPLYSQVSGAHSMADPVEGAGRTFSFYGANLIRKYGEEWAAQWRESVYRRLRHWGFTTIANWSQEDVLQHSDVPFVVSTGLNRVRKIEGAKGYWGKMMDVYDPSFEENVDGAIAYVAARHGDNPMCIGYFVDNELAWEGVVAGVLASDATQPARRRLITLLQERYTSLEKLNSAWGCEFTHWDAINETVKTNAAARGDLSDFFYTFALRYFTVIQDAIREHASEQLYLGCRFSTAPNEAVRACAEVADVLSFNLYYPRIPEDMFTGAQALEKPVMIGEFHFGALDRGMFHTGLVGVRDQEDRAAHYAAYVRSVIDHPGFVGCHWFQYIDEPITGRWYDGENYNIGFVDVTDTPYTEMVEAARRVHDEAYRRRWDLSSGESEKQ